jgi:hypothetical protein
MDMAGITFSNHSSRILGNLHISNIHPHNTPMAMLLSQRSMDPFPLLIPTTRQLLDRDHPLLPLLVQALPTLRHR